MKKRALSLALALLLTTAFFPTALAAETRSYHIFESQLISVVFSVSNVISSEESTEPIGGYSATDTWLHVKALSPCVINVDDYADLFFNSCLSFDDWKKNGPPVFAFIDSPPSDYKKSGTFTLEAGFYALEGGYMNLPGEYKVDSSLPYGMLLEVIDSPADSPAASNSTQLKNTAGLFSVIPPSPIITTSDISFVVKKGDSLAKIAQKYNTTVDKIKTSNKAYFDSLAERNMKQGTNVQLEENITLLITNVTETKDLAYTVQKSETFSGIAFNYYGSMSNANISKIKAANAEYLKRTNGILEAGAVITLPAEGLINPVTQSHLDKAAGMYLVKTGDTLGDIAKVYYGNFNSWTKIYEANKDRIKIVRNNPIIYKGQWLVIPE